MFAIFLCNIFRQTICRSPKDEYLRYTSFGSFMSLKPHVDQHDLNPSETKHRQTRSEHVIHVSVQHQQHQHPTLLLRPLF